MFFCLYVYVCLSVSTAGLEGKLSAVTQKLSQYVCLSVCQYVYLCVWYCRLGGQVVERHSQAESVDGRR